MKKILVPTDFSLASKNVMKYAAGLARQAGATIQLLNVYTEAPLPAEAPGAWTYLHDFREQYEKDINKEISRLKEQYNIDVNGDLREGFTSDTINNVANEVSADLIIIGIKSTRHNRLTGSTGLKLIRKTSIPVLIIPPAVKFKPVKNIILAIDFKEMVNSHCFDFLFSLVEKFNAALTVVHVEKPGADLDAAEVAEKIQLEIVLSKVSHTYHKVENENIDQGVYEFLQEHPVDWLVMIEHHHNFLERAFGELHTRSVIFNTDIPVLVLKNK